MNTVPKIMIQSDGLKAIGSYAASLWKKKKIVLISDKESFDTYGTQILQYLTIFDFEVHSLILNEVLYTTNTANLVYSFLTNQKMTKADGIIGLGNEAVCQLSGYVSATYHGGVSLIQIPTTLFSQLTIAKQKQACLLNVAARHLQLVTTQLDGVIIDTNISAIVSQEELISIQTFLLNLGLSQDSKCRCELRKKARIYDHQLNYKEILDSLPSNLPIGKKMCLRSEKQVINSRALSLFKSHSIS
ncbi:hypothetical protein [Enterococcus sp. AZ196]|uniref:hypothetical protein n=1 Tax=Enterococcus sp. AZ196 TaxID=2774659 RepID=UPI003D29F5A7